MDTPYSLYEMTALLLRANLIDLPTLYPYVSYSLIFVILLVIIRLDCHQHYYRS